MRLESKARVVLHASEARKSVLFRTIARKDSGKYFYGNFHFAVVVLVKLS